MHRGISIILSGALALTAAHSVTACEFHGYTPDPTLVDILLGTEQVVIARPDPTDPSRYVAIEALLGPGEIAIPIPVSPEISVTLQQDQTVLLAREEAYGPWLELAVLDASYRHLIDTVIARQSDWLYNGDEDRFQMFADLVNHDNPDIRELALRELDRADYTVLHGLNVPPVATLRQDVQRFDDDLRPIRILLAGLSGDRTYSELIGAGLARAVSLDLPYLGAYATALIELQGPTAIKTIVDGYFLSGDVSPQTHERLLEAFAIKNQTAHSMTSRAIRQGVGQVLDASPELAGAAARQFGIRSDWSIAAHIARASQTAPPTSEEDMFALNQYIDIAQRIDQDR